jgi:ribosome recycling factor
MDESLKDLIELTSSEMDGAINHLKKDLSGIRAGKASPGLLDGVKVEYYGSQMPISQVATIGAPDARLITVQPWEKNMIPAIEKAIRASNLGLNPMTDGPIIRVPLPMLTEERRRDLVKICREAGEKAKVIIRAARRDGNEAVKKTVKDNHLSEDMRFTAEEHIQKFTDKHIALVDDLLKKKEDEILTV